MCVKPILLSPLPEGAEVSVSKSPFLRLSRSFFNLRYDLLKSIFLVLLLALRFSTLARDASPTQGQNGLPALVDVNAFAQKDREMVRVVVAALVESGYHPKDYFLELTPRGDAKVAVYLKHKSHPADNRVWRGDACGRCLTTMYDSRTGRIAAWGGIR